MKRLVDNPLKFSVPFLEFSFWEGDWGLGLI